MNIEYNIVFESACEFIFRKYYRFEVKLSQIGSFTSHVSDNFCIGVELSGEKKSHICLISSKEAAIELTSRIMGLDKESAESEAESGLKELLNLICGRMKQMMEKANRPFNFSLPQNGKLSKKGFQFWIKADFKGTEAAVALFLD